MFHNFFCRRQNSQGHDGPMMLGKTIPTDNTEVGWETHWRKKSVSQKLLIRVCYRDPIVKTKPEEGSYLSVCINLRTSRGHISIFSRDFIHCLDLLVYSVVDFMCIRKKTNPWDLFFQILLLECSTSTGQSWENNIVLQIASESKHTNQL